MTSPRWKDRSLSAFGAEYDWVGNIEREGLHHFLGDGFVFLEVIGLKV
jgi:hypothetical protein